MNKKWKIVFTALALLAGLVVVYVVRKGDCSQDLQEAELLSLLQNPRPVGIERVGPPLESTAFTYPAVVAAGERSELAFRVSGPLVHVATVLGKPVAEGTLLMQIDSRDYEDRVHSLTAALAGARAALVKAEADFARARGLLAENVISQADYDGASAQRDVCQARVDELLVAVQSAQHALADTVLTAPFSGTVTQQKIENFEMVSAGKPVLTLLNTGFLDVVIQIPEEDVAAHTLVEGAAAKVRILTIPDRLFDVGLKEWSSVADEVTRTYALTFRMKAPDDVLVLPGMTAEVEWRPEEEAGRLLLSVPVEAVCRANGSSAVWVYDAETQTARKQQVETGRQTGRDHLEILKGLDVGDVIVTAGSDYVKDGMKLVPLVTTELE